MLSFSTVRTTMVLNRSAFKTYFDLSDVSGNFLSLMGPTGGVGAAAQSDRSDDHESDGGGSCKSSKKSNNSSLGTCLMPAR